MARQAEAERERRAKVIAATGELEASQELSEAAAKLYESPGALQLRALQTLAEVASEHNSTLVFPVPIELLTGFIGKGRCRRLDPARGGRAAPASQPPAPGRPVGIARWAAARGGSAESEPRPDELWGAQEPPPPS